MTSRTEFSVRVCKATELSVADMARAIEIVKAGAAVDTARLGSNLLASEWTALVSCGSDLAGVGVIKGERKNYLLRVAKKSDYSIGLDCRELGYVAVSPSYRGKRLSSLLVQKLLAAYSGDLFATTFNPIMMQTLRMTGFERVGREWPSVESPGSLVSLWIRNQIVP
jgi:GNAT superfamily N-acetyltransferase